MNLAGSPWHAVSWMAGPPGNPSPEQARAFVERLSGRVVECAAEMAELAVPGHQDQFGVAAGDEEADERERGRLDLAGARPLQPVGVNVRLEVVDRHQRPVERVGETLGGVHTDDEGAGQPWSLRDGDGVDLVPVDRGLAQRLLRPPARWR